MKPVQALKMAGMVVPFSSPLFPEPILFHIISKETEDGRVSWKSPVVGAKKEEDTWVWTHPCVIPVLGRLRQEDLRFEKDFNYIEDPALF